MGVMAEETARCAAGIGATCGDCTHFHARPDYLPDAGECRASRVLGPPYAIHEYRRRATACFWFEPAGDWLDRHVDEMREWRREHPRDGQEVVE